MNKETRLLAVLDEGFGIENKLGSQFRKVGQDFDENTNGHGKDLVFHEPFPQRHLSGRSPFHTTIAMRATVTPTKYAKRYCGVEIMIKPAVRADTYTNNTTQPCHAAGKLHPQP